MIYKKFDIVKVPFPFTDKPTAKKRPSLVISSTDFQTNHDHCILAMITTAKQSDWIDDIEITNISIAGVPVPSKIRFKIFTIDTSLILEKIGCLIEEDQHKVQQKLKYYFINKN